LKSGTGEIYRITRDFINKRQGLSRLDSTRKFMPIQKDDTKILQFIQQELQGLNGEDLERISLLRRTELPSILPRTLRREREDPLEQTLTATDLPLETTMQPPEPPATSVKSQEKGPRLAELKAMLAKAEEVARIEERLSEQQDRAADLKRRIQNWKEKNEELKTLVNQEAALAPFAQFPPNLAVLIDAYEQGERQQHPLLQEIDDEKTDLLNTLVTLPEGDFLQNKFLWTGTGIIAITLIAGLILSLEGIWRHLFPVGFAIGIGLIIGSVLKDRSNASKRTSLHDQIDRLYKKQESLEEAFQKEHAPFLEILKKSGCKDMKELQEKNRVYRNLSQTRQNLEDQMKELLQGKILEELKAEQTTCNQKIAEIESQIRSYGSVPTDLYSLQEEIRRLERGNTPDETLTLQNPTADDRTEMIPRPPSDVIATTLSSKLHPSNYRKLAPMDPESLQATATLLLKQLAPDSQWEIVFSSEGVVSLRGPDGSPLSWENISSGSLDLLWAVLFLSEQGLLKEKHPFPLLLDDPFIGLDSKRQDALLEVLRAMGRHRQVILCTTRTLPTKEGDHQVIL
jgi:uncharacterized membrane protein